MAFNVMFKLGIKFNLKIQGINVWRLITSAFLKACSSAIKKKPNELALSFVSFNYLAKR